MKFPKVLTAGSESEGSDEDVGEGVSWEEGRRLNNSRRDCNLREGFVDMVEETMARSVRGCVIDAVMKIRSVAIFSVCCGV